MFISFKKARPHTCRLSSSLRILLTLISISLLTGLTATDSSLRQGSMVRQIARSIAVFTERALGILSATDSHRGVCGKRQAPLNYVPGRGSLGVLHFTRAFTVTFKKIQTTNKNQKQNNNNNNKTKQNNNNKKKKKHTKKQKQQQKSSPKLVTSSQKWAKSIKDEIDVGVKIFSLSKIDNCSSLHPTYCPHSALCVCFLC